MKCNVCNNELKNEARFCPACGTPVNNQQPVQNQVFTQPVNQQPNIQVNSGMQPVNQNQPKNNKTAIILAIVFGIIALVAIIIALVATSSNNNEDKKEKEEVNESVNNNDNDLDNEDDFDTEIEEDSGSSAVTGVSNDWKNYEMSINGKSFKLPISYSEFEQITGFSMQDSKKETLLEDGYYTLANLYKDDKLVASIDLLNDTGSTIKYSECLVTSVYQTAYNVKNNKGTFEFAKGLKIGMPMTEEQLKNMFGEPARTHDYENGEYKYVTYTYAESEFSTYNNFEIRLLNNVVDEVSLDHRDYK